MQKVSIIRKGANRPVLLPARVAAALVRGGGFDYVEETTTKKAAGAVSAKPQAEGPNIHPAAPYARPTAAQERPVKAQLEEMSKAELVSELERYGEKHLSRDTKEDVLAKVMRYKRRDMRAEK